MPERPLLYETVLANGLRVTVTDVTRHYYGGYWQVALEVACPVPFEAGEFSDSGEHEEARRLLGESVPFVRRVERMAVPNDELEATRAGLLERIERHLVPFLAHERFPARFIQTEFQQRGKKSLRGIPCLV